MGTLGSDLTSPMTEPNRTRNPVTRHHVLEKPLPSSLGQSPGTSNVPSCCVLRPRSQTHLAISPEAP